MKLSNSSGRSRFSEERAMEEKPKLAELMAEVEFAQRRQMAEDPTEQIGDQEKLAKAKTRSEVYEAMERKGSEVDQSEIIEDPNGNCYWTAGDYTQASSEISSCR